MLRIPGTDTAALDLGGTIAIAWLISVVTFARLSLSCIGVFCVGEFLHRLFCVFD
jgi:hypothetical protein